MMWRRFRQNRLSVFGLIVIGLFYLTMVCFPGFIAPYYHDRKFDDYVFAPPSKIRFVDEEGNFHWRPFIYGRKTELDFYTLTWVFTEDPTSKHPIYFFVRGDSYRLFGFIPANIHLFGTTTGEPIFLLGTDRLGRDLLSRIIYGGQISLTVGLVGVILTIFLGTFLGTVSGYYGGTVDNIIQRIGEVLLSFPDIPLWAALAAAMPPDWSQITVFFGISVILSLRNWSGLARQLRGKVLALRESEFVLAAKGLGASDLYVIFRHLIPSTLSHIIVIATLSIPGMILAETALSFLGLGIQPPMASWGVLLQDAQQVSVVLNRPWLLLPGLFVVAAVLCFNFLGDGIRDAADPYMDHR
ncbi:MAG TPA: ABC transporter permease [Limnochordia bacterium]|nr:ABC transporter permease [Limnochordia bacterium]